MKRRYVLLSILAITILAFAVRKPDGEHTEISEHTSIAQHYNPANEITSILTPFDSIVSENFESSGTVGAAVVITYKGQVALMKCLGVRKEGNEAPVNKHTVFRLASVSKSITGILASILDDENIVNMEDKVVAYLPEFQLKNPDYTQQLTVKNLLSQSSGVVPHAYDLMVEDQWPLEKIIPYLKEATVTAAPGQLYTYQNVVYSIYEPIIEAKVQKDFEEVMSEKVFTPFGMTDASLNFQTFKNDNNKAYPHTKVGKTQYRSIPLNDRYYNTAPAAGVNASISDMSQLLIGLSGHHPDLFSPQAEQTAFTPQIKTPLKRQYFSSWGREVKNKSYAIGWRIIDYQGKRIAYHGGYVKGYKAEIALYNEGEVGIAILSNSPNNISSKWIPTFLNMYFEYNKSVLAAVNKKQTIAPLKD